MSVRITAKDQAIMDEMAKAADRGELAFRREAALRRDPDGPLERESWPLYARYWLSVSAALPWIAWRCMS